MIYSFFLGDAHSTLPSRPNQLLGLNLKTDLGLGLVSDTDRDDYLNQIYIWSTTQIQIQIVALLLFRSHSGLDGPLTQQKSGLSLNSQVPHS